MTKRLTRDVQNKMVAGVAAGLAKYFQLDVTWVRIAFALAAFFGGGGLWIYIILWIAVPEERISPFTYTDYRVDEDKASHPDNFGSTFKPNDSNIGVIAGFILIGLGAYFLMAEFDFLPYWFKIRKLWPLVFVVIGLIILTKNKNQEIDYQNFKDQPKDHSDSPKEEEKKTDTNDQQNL